nr:Gfo/Idh/MocA family oxidoreductase [Salsipaludibacter albus]
MADGRGRGLDRPLRVVVVGAGARGAAYADLVGTVGVPAEVVAIAEPRAQVRDDVGDRLHLPADARLASWQDLVDRPRLADLAIVATQDRDHVDPVVALADLGYDLLVEKPLAPTAEGIAAIVAAADRTGVTVAVCHVMRFTAYTHTLLDLLATGDLGEVMAVQHLEPIGWEHFAHSFVRGNWRRRDTSSFLLLAKSCHDLDWLHAVVGDEPVRVSSFGSRGHFRAEHRPDGAADRCVDCEVEPDCPYSAARLYRRGLDPADASAHYFARIAVGGIDPTPERVESALRDGPWGRCVYDLDNDVVDHQVVTIEFARGATVAFTLTAFTPSEGRRTRVFATHGQVVGDGRHLEVTDFRSGRMRTIDTHTHGDETAAGGHGGGDAGMVRAVLTALHDGRGEIPSGLAESLVSHRLAFAGDLARRESRVVDLAEFAW